MNLIAAVDRNWAIGKDNKLLANIPEDMKFFRETTTGGVVVMGRKTLESFPNGKPLPKRTNIVLTRDRKYKAEGAVIVHDTDELEKVLADYDTQNVFCIGGGSIYKLLEPMCDSAYITKIDYAYDADTFFPDLDASDEWEMTEESEEKTCFDLIYTFTKYTRVK